MKCPGYLYAKTLLEAGSNPAEYREWYVNDTLSSRVGCIRQITEAFHFTASGSCVLAFLSHEDSSGLLFRFRLMKNDVYGRPHSRIEVMLIAKRDLPSLVNGTFRADPDEKDGTFNIVPMDGDKLESLEDQTIGEFRLNVWGVPDTFYFSSALKTESNTASPRHHTSKRIKSNMDNSSNGKKEAKKCFVFILFCMVLLVLSGYVIIRQSIEIRRLNNELFQSREKLEQFKSENQRLRSWAAKQEQREKEIMLIRDSLKKTHEEILKSEKLLSEKLKGR